MKEKKTEKAMMEEISDKQVEKEMRTEVPRMMKSKTNRE